MLSLYRASSLQNNSINQWVVFRSWPVRQVEGMGIEETGHGGWEFEQRLHS
jgi:hypothetical protein